MLRDLQSLWSRGVLSYLSVSTHRSCEVLKRESAILYLVYEIISKYFSELKLHLYV